MDSVRILISGVSVLVITAGCAPAPGSKPRPRTKPRPVASQQVRAERLGKRAVSRLGGALRRRVFAALKKGGPAAAIEACATDAQRISARINRELGGQVSIKRTSLRVRNPDNAPDAAERSVLRRLARELQQGMTPGPVLAGQPGADGMVYRYYVPIRVGGLCTKCHGPVDKLAPSIRTVLQKRYPADRATGYRAGDLRGVFSVTIKPAALR